MPKLLQPAQMAIKFEVLDGFKPTRDPATGVFKLLLPHELSLAPGQEFLVKGGVKCNYPVHFFASWERKKLGVDLVDGVWACQDSNQDLEVKVKNVGDKHLVLETREPIAKFTVMHGHYLPVEE